jgi:hypothetical protein
MEGVEIGVMGGQIGYFQLLNRRKTKLKTRRKAETLPLTFFLQGV